jgi:hypothetical protein
MSNWIKFDKNDLTTWPPYKVNVLAIDEYKDIQTVSHDTYDFDEDDEDASETDDFGKNEHFLAMAHECSYDYTHDVTDSVTHWRPMIDLPEDL